MQRIAFKSYCFNWHIMQEIWDSVAKMHMKAYIMSCQQVTLMMKNFVK